MHLYEVEYLSKFFFCRCHSCCFRWPFYKESKQTKNLPLRSRLKYYFVRISRECDTPGWISQSKQSISICDWRAEPLSLHLQARSVTGRLLRTRLWDRFQSGSLHMHERTWIYFMCESLHQVDFTIWSMLFFFISIVTGFNIKAAKKKKR